MPPPTYFNRWRRYPRSCAGHTLQGFIIGLLILAPPLLMGGRGFAVTAFALLQAQGYFAYQFGSGARKAINRHQTDSIGWDCADLSVGGWLALLACGIYFAYKCWQDGVFPPQFPPLF